MIANLVNTQAIQHSRILSGACTKSIDEMEPEDPFSAPVLDKMLTSCLLELTLANQNDVDAQEIRKQEAQLGVTEDLVKLLLIQAERTARTLQTRPDLLDDATDEKVVVNIVLFIIYYYYLCVQVVL